MTTDPMTPLDTRRAALELVEQQLAAATRGPWFDWEDGGDIGICSNDGLVDIVKVEGETDGHDAALIVTSVALLPVGRDILTDAIETLQDPGWAPGQKIVRTLDALRLARAIVKDGDLT